jgi:hypothetical protein
LWCFGCLLRQLLQWLRASAGRCSGDRETDSAAWNSSAPVHSGHFLAITATTIRKAHAQKQKQHYVFRELQINKRDLNFRNSLACQFCWHYT